MFAVHIAGIANAIANNLPRKASDHERQLNKTVFQSLVSLFPSITFDLFTYRGALTDKRPL